MRGFIYKITNNINGKVYIGQTIQPIKERFYRHCARACSEDESNMAIHKAIRKYGKENFTLELLEETDNLNEREIYYISKYDSFKNGYNSTKGGQLGNKPFKTLDIEAIIREYLKGTSLRNLGKEFHVDKQTIKGLLIRNNVTLRNTRTYKLSQEDRLFIIKQVNDVRPRKDIMSDFNISKGYLSQLISGYRRI
jgi:group I intron endonuclease